MHGSTCTISFTCSCGYLITVVVFTLSCTISLFLSVFLYSGNDSYTMIRPRPYFYCTDGTGEILSLGGCGFWNFYHWYTFQKPAFLGMLYLIRINIPPYLWRIRGVMPVPLNIWLPIITNYFHSPLLCPSVTQTYFFKGFSVIRVWACISDLR